MISIPGRAIEVIGMSAFEQSSKELPRSRAARLVGVAAAVLLVAALVYFGRRAGGAIPRLAGAVDRLGAWGPILFAAAYAIATVAFVPGTILTLVAGALFGLAAGTATVFAGAVAGSTAAFFIARYAARGFVGRKIAGNPRFERIDRAVGEKGLPIVILMRLSPAFPFNLLNYALGLTKISLRDYLIASVAMLPSTFLFVYYGTLIGSVAAVTAGAKVPHDGAWWALLIGGLLATIGVTWIVGRITRRALREVS
jgi:uncharacterized membrane protein YdjX (TVP38/TMEM64 family)